MTSNLPAIDDSSLQPFTITLDAHAQLPALQWSDVGNRKLNRPFESVAGPPTASEIHNGLEALESWLLAEGIRPRSTFHARQKTRPVLSQAVLSETSVGTEAFLPIQLKANVNSLATLALAINDSAIRFLSVTYNPHPTVSVLSALLGSLHVRGLHTLQVFGRLSPDTVPVLASYIASPRSAGLTVLRIDRGECTVRDLEPLVDAIEHNTTIQKVWTVSSYDTVGFVDLFSLMERPNPTPRIRLTLYRNKELAVRVRTTVLTALGPSRVLLRARSPGSAAASSSLFARLPLELVTLVLQLASPDALALLPAQWHTLFEYAADPGREGRTAQAIKQEVEGGRPLDAVIDEWLLCGGLWWARGCELI